MTEFKTNKKHFEEIINDGKRFEVRTNDRIGFFVGERICLKEYLGSISIPSCPDLHFCKERLYCAVNNEPPICPLDRKSCDKYTFEQYSGRKIYAKITKVFDISDVFAGLVAFEFEIYNQKL